MDDMSADDQRAAPADTADELEARGQPAEIDPPPAPEIGSSEPAGGEAARDGDVAAASSPEPTSLPRSYEGLVGRSKHRYVGPDVVRAVALIGVVLMNYHGYLIHRGGQVGTGFVNQLFNPWYGPFATRFAATFVLIAGVGTTLLTRSVIGDRSATRSRRWTLVRRGLLLFVGGMFLNEIWDGTILPYYGAMFIVGAIVFTCRTWAVALLGAVAAVAGMVIHGWAIARAADGSPIEFLQPSGRWNPHAILINTFVNGTHPLLPWLTFFCGGLILGRFLGSPRWRAVAIVAGLAGYAVGRLVAQLEPSGEVAHQLTRDGPWERSLPFVVSALGTALVATAVISWLAERFASSRPVDWLRHAGQMTLTIYVAHALVFNLIVDWLGWIRPTGLDTAMLFAAGFWAVAIAFGALWHRHVGIGPLEWLYRELSA